MIKLNKPSDCCGCTACASVCSHNAITMKPDALGFLYPVVDKNKCVDCGLCEAICPFNEHYDTSLNFEVPIVYGARHKDINEVMQSRSGCGFCCHFRFYIGQWWRCLWRLLLKSIQNHT